MLRMPWMLHASDSRMTSLLSIARTALGADALCLWRVDASGAALPVLSSSTAAPPKTSPLRRHRSELRHPLRG